MGYTGATVEDPATGSKAPEAYVGYRVHDPEGRKIRRAKELFRNASGELEYVRVRMSFFGLKSFLIPIGFVAVDEQRRT